MSNLYLLSLYDILHEKILLKCWKIRLNFILAKRFLIYDV